MLVEYLSVSNALKIEAYSVMYVDLIHKGVCTATISFWSFCGSLFFFGRFEDNSFL